MEDNRLLVMERNHNLGVQGIEQFVSELSFINSLYLTLWTVRGVSFLLSPLGQEMPAKILNSRTSSSVVSVATSVVEGLNFKVKEQSQYTKELG